MSALRFSITLCIITYTVGTHIDLPYQHELPENVVHLLIKQKSWFVYVEHLLMNINKFKQKDVSSVMKNMLQSIRTPINWIRTVYVDRQTVSISL